MDLNKLLKPKTVAIVGASEKAGFGGSTTRNFLKFTKNPDRLYLVNPGREVIFDRPAYKSVSDIPVDIDLVVLCTPQQTIIPLLREAALKNCGGAVVFASGYSELGGDGIRLQEELVSEADRLGIAVMGPNCAGFSNFAEGIFAFAFLVEERDRSGNIGMISQSGQIAMGGLDSPKMGFSYNISSGNSCNVKVEDYLNFLVDDEDTKVVAAYIEGITNPPRFEEALRKAALKRKPVVILKTGRSAKSQELAASHTGSLSGADKVLRAVFKKYGVVEAHDLEELCSFATAFSWLGEMPRGGRCVYMDVSGGEASVMADLAGDYDLCLPEYAPDTKAKLEALLPEYGSVNNPLDMTAVIGYNVPAMCEAMRVISRDDNVDALCIAYTMTPEIWDETIACMVEAAVIVRQDEDMKPVFWLPFNEHTRHPESVAKLKNAGVPMLATGHYGCSALREIFRFAEFKFEDTPQALPQRRHRGFYGLSEFDSLNYLSAWGVPIPPQAVAETPQQAAAEALKLGYPLSAKIHSADIQHKSDVGGVKLGIKNEQELMEAFDEIMANCAKNAPEAKLSGVLLKPMLKTGVEMIIGVNNDPDFGPMIMTGMGGVFVELFKDVQLAPAPLSYGGAVSMLKALKSYPLLTGYRGSAPCDIDGLAKLLVSISRMAADGKDSIKELDINPVFVTDNGVSIADALLILYDETDG